jgi:WD40 repeat protein
VAFSHNSIRLASASHDSTVKMWDVSSDTCLLTLDGHSDWVSSVAFSHDSTHLASASHDSTVKMWDVSSGACLQTLEGHSDWVSSVVFSHNSTRLASALHDCTVKVWDVSSGACLQTLKGHSDRVSSVAFSHDSTCLASASDDCTVKVWDVSSGACLQTLKVGKTLFNILFNAASSCLHTEIGTIAIGASSPSYMTLNRVEPQDAQYQGGGLSSDGAWITYNSENLVWLPSEYRPSCSAVSGRTVGIGNESEKVCMCSFHIENS